MTIESSDIKDAVKDLDKLLFEAIAQDDWKPNFKEVLYASRKLVIDIQMLLEV